METLYSIMIDDVEIKNSQRTYYSFTTLRSFIESKIASTVFIVVSISLRFVMDFSSLFSINSMKYFI